MKRAAAQHIRHATIADHPTGGQIKVILPRRPDPGKLRAAFLLASVRRRDAER
jgi:hypothetical protein